MVVLGSFSMDSSSISTISKPASAALSRTSRAAALEPSKRPPLASQRQVATAVVAVFSARKVFSRGSAARGLGR